MQDESTWEEMRQGLSIFSSTDRNYTLRLPFKVAPQVIIGERFHIKPTLPWLARNGQFYILTLSRNRLRLLECDPQKCSHIDLGNTPTSMQEALKFDDPERYLTLHTSEQQGDRVPSGDPAVFHGHGIGSDNQEANLRRYFQAAAEGIEDYLAGRQAPLLLHGVEENVAIYREVSKYPHLMEEAIFGNPDQKDNDDLFGDAIEYMHDYHTREMSKAKQRFNDHRGTEQVSKELEDVLKHAFQARVAYLFLSLEDHIWGQFEPETMAIKHTQEEYADRVDLLDLCAVYTLKHGGKVYTLPRDQMPIEESPVAALFRF
jgi:hypothetical protein